MKQEMLVIFVTYFVAIFGSVVTDEGWFWHVTDFHYDFSYWGNKLSCNGVNISDPGIFGNQWCDSPWRLVEDTITGIRNVKDDVDFILWTGDSVPHVSSDNLNTELNKELVRNITQLMKSEFPSVPIYATFGNHDYYKTNLFPPHGNDIYNATYILWKSWINESSQEANFLKGGYYTVLASSGIRIVALNTNMYYYKDTLTQNLTDPADQFAWLDSVLTNATTNNEKVILTGHVPPGLTTPRAVRWMSQSFNKKLIDVITRHHTVIVAMHFGHEHHDNFRLIYDSLGNPLVAVFIAPSVTPWRYQLPTETEPAHNPGARLVKYDRQTGKQLDILQYYVDLPRANAAKLISWILGYNVTTTYGIPDLTPVSMDAAVKKMVHLTSSEFKAYVNWYNTNAKNFACNEQCHKKIMCGFKNLEDASFQKCMSSVSSGSSACHYTGYVVFILVHIVLFLVLKLI